jgi:hypothetical protein
MRPTRTFAPAAAFLSLTIVLAACGQAVANPAEPTPPASPTPDPTTQPSAEPPVTPTPVATPVVTPTPMPTPRPISVIEHELPMIARAIADGVNVRVRPGLDAPLLSGERYSDLSSVPNIRLAKGERVFATMGPILRDGESWYEVGKFDGGDIHWEFGWVAARFLERLSGDPTYNPLIIDVHGLGSGTAVTGEVVMHGSPLTVRVAAAPMPDRATCELEVVVIGTDGTAIQVATESVDGATVFQKTHFDVPGLWQEVVGTFTLQVRTDCSYAATVAMPQA